jgi:hypothetical protein
MRVPSLETNNSLGFIHQQPQLTRGSKYCSSISVGPTTGQTGYRLSRSASVPFCVAFRRVFVLLLFCVAEVFVCEVLAAEARCALEICIWVSRDWLAQRSFIF